MKRPLLIALALVAAALAALYRPELDPSEVEAQYADGASRFAEIAGLRVHYKEEGQGPPLLLIHGTAASLHTWDGWVDELGGDFRLLRLDLPGFGLTGPDPAGDYSHARRVEVLSAFLDHVGVDRAAVAGNSLGGALALALAAAEPERVERLVLLDPAGYPEQREVGFVFFDLARLPVVNWFFTRLTPRFLVALAVEQAYGDTSRVQPQVVDRYARLLRRRGNRKALLQGLAQDAPLDREALGRLEQPTLLQWGRRDRLISIALAELFQSDLRDTTLVVYDDAGHVPMEEIPTRSAADARRFLLGGAVGAGDNQEVRGRGEGKDNWWDALPRPAWFEFRRVEQSQDWFEVYEIRPGVLAIYEPGQFEEIISYLILGSERALLFDTGLGIGDMRQLVAELTDLPVAVLNSHTHYDHVGGNHAFDRIYGTPLEYTREHERGRSHDAVAEFVGPGWIWKETPDGFSPKSYVSRPFRVTDPVTDGQVIGLGDVELEVLLTPGHAPDSLCLLDRERRLLFTGDTFYLATLYAHLPGSIFSEYQQTAARLAALAPEVDVVLPAHNEPTMPAAELVRLGEAFRALPGDDLPFVLTDGHREYDFGRFSVLVSEPPPWQ